MKKFYIAAYVILSVVSLALYVFTNLYLCIDCREIMSAGYTEEIGVGMAIILGAVCLFAFICSFSELLIWIFGKRDSSAAADENK